MPVKQDFIDALEHIQIICKIYDSSSTKIERIDIYTKGLLAKLKKKGQTNNAKRKGRNSEN